jgi:uncharacterized protein YtpQ (UPF0354 family)
VHPEAVRAAVLPQFFPADWLAESPIVCSNFPSRIRVGYVLRERGRYSYLLRQDLDGLRIVLEELHAAALDNLLRLPSGRITLAEPPGGAEGFIASDDNFAAARILLPGVRKRFADTLGEEFFAILPHRDSCFCWNCGQPIGRQTRHAAEALEDFAQDDYRLTPDIFRVSMTGFVLHRAQ